MCSLSLCFLYKSSSSNYSAQQWALQIILKPCKLIHQLKKKIKFTLNLQIKVNDLQYYLFHNFIIFFIKAKFSYFIRCRFSRLCLAKLVGLQINFSMRLQSDTENSVSRFINANFVQFMNLCYDSRFNLASLCH